MKELLLPKLSHNKLAQICCNKVFRVLRVRELPVGTGLVGVQSSKPHIGPRNDESETRPVHESAFGRLATATECYYSRSSLAYARTCLSNDKQRQDKLLYDKRLYAASEFSSNVTNIIQNILQLTYVYDSLL